MADTQHTLEITMTTQDFASANIKRLGDEGLKAGQNISAGVSSASGKAKEFVDSFLKIDPAFKKIASAGIGAMSSINAGIVTAKASSENLGQAAMGAATSIVSGFASGGLVGGAIASASAGLGLLINLFDDVGESAVRNADEAAAAIEKMGSATRERFSGIRKSWNELTTDVFVAQQKLLGRAVNEPLLKLDARLKDSLIENQKNIAALRKEVDRATEDLQGGIKNKEDSQTIAKRQRALDDAREALHVEQQRTGAINASYEQEKRLLELRDRLGQKEKEAKKEAEKSGKNGSAAEEAKSRAYAEGVQRLRDQVSEVVRRSKMNEEDLAVEELRRLAQSALLAGLKDEAKVLFDLERQRRDEFKKKQAENSEEFRAAQAKEKASKEHLQNLREEIAEVVRKSKLSKEDLTVDNLRLLAQDAIRNGLLQEGAILLDLEKRRRAEYRADQQAKEDKKKGLKDQVDLATKYDEKRQKTLETEKKLAEAIQKGASALQAGGSMRQTPGRGAPASKFAMKEAGIEPPAQEAPDLFPEGSLAEARQARRDELRARKRRRAAGARGMGGFSLGRSGAFISGRRRGGLGAFSGAFQPTPMPVGEPLPSPEDLVPPLPPEGALPPAAPGGLPGGPGGKKPGAAITSAGMAQEAAAAAAKTAEALKGVEDAVGKMKDSSEAGKSAAEGAREGSQSAADALKATADSLDGVAGAMQSAATNAQGLADRVNRLMEDVRRLQDAMNLRGGN